MSGEELPSEPRYRAPRVSLAAATVAVLIASAVTLPAGVGGYLATIGGVVTVGSVVAGVKRGVFLGIGGVFAGVVYAGATGSGVGTVVIAAVATIVAYDAGHLAVDLGGTMRATGITTRAELTHLGGTTIVAAGAAAVGVTGYELAAGEQPVTALVALLLAGVILLWALRSR